VCCCRSCISPCFLMLLRRGLTPGKPQVGLQVGCAQTGALPGFGTIFVREVVGHFVSGIVLGLVCLWSIMDKSKQAWHDRIAGTIVVRLR
jgi:uncharacterized RDD family membrane protein YckC